MANPDHVAILKQGAQAWNRWRMLDLPPDPLERFVDVRTLELADLRHGDLGNANLSGADLRGANLSGVNLYEADLSHANLSAGTLSGADLRRANLRRANLSEVRFFWADLSLAILDEANLRGAKFGLTHFQRTSLAGVDLSEVESMTSSGLDPATVQISPRLPEAFLRGCGWPEPLIQYWPAISSAAIQFYSGFISYSHAEPDQSFARRLYDQLQGRGIRVWLDKHEVNPGDFLMAEIDRAIFLFDKTLLCCSANSLKSWWVEREIEKALGKERAAFEQTGEKVLNLIPLDLDGYLFASWEHEYKSCLTERLVADFTGWESDYARFDEEFERVVRAMKPGGGKLPLSNKPLRK